MKPATLEQIRHAIGGRALAPIPKTAPAVQHVCTDTRMLQPGCVFVALKGEKYDAHAFIPEAAAGGAIAAIVQDVPAQAMPNLHLIKVADTRIALGKIANFARKHMRCKVIAVAGSNGKTTTKYLINSVLSASLRGTMSPKSFNNDIGVPLTILPADPNADYLVLEMGTNHHGEIQRLTEMATPDIAVITNCGAEHLEFLDDLRGVRQENASIIRGLRPRGMLAVNGDDAELVSAVSAYSGKILKFGFDTTNDLFASDVRCDQNGTRFFLNNSKREIFVPMLGRHAALNALAAIAVARRLGLNDDAIMDALATARGPDMRLQMMSVAGVSVLNDAYNANPNSMRAALETTANLKTRGRRVAVLGDMRELGESSERYHRELGEFAATCKLDLLACVGAQAAILAESAERMGMPTGAICRFPDARSAAASIPGFLRDGDLVLLKASRGIGLELVAQAISESRAAKSQRLRRVAS
ncbi:MAG: UDP-N-acetylmuramoyl-tripeptide--D-alanyl-D-alanine ligase [Anaerolineae bacterium]|nr:UDP-N-acetylmuramoyl-tripeptide--D-alanyl-D-alanine ligase [Phycisphaerae bacterium]